MDFRVLTQRTSLTPLRNSGSLEDVAHGVAVVGAGYAGNGGGGDLRRKAFR